MKMAIAAKRSLGVPGALASSLSWLQQYHSLEYDVRTFAAYLASTIQLQRILVRVHSYETPHREMLGGQMMTAVAVASVWTDGDPFNFTELERACAPGQHGATSQDLRGARAHN